MILTPKRKLQLTPEIEYLIDHTKETTISEIDSGYRANRRIGRFSHRLQIPVGENKYDSLTEEGDIGVVVATTEVVASMGLGGQDILYVSGNVYLLAYRDGSNDGWVETVSISDDGATISSIDTLEFANGVSMNYPRLVHVAGDVYAVAYNDYGNTNGTIATFSVDLAGAIGAAIIDSGNFSDDRIESFVDIVHVSGNVFAVAYALYVGVSQDDGYVKTISIDIDGTVGAVIDNLKFEDSYCLDPHIIRVGTSDYYAVSYVAANNDGWVVTMSISSAGAIGDSVTDSLEFDTDGVNYTTIIHVDGNYYAVAYCKPGGHGAVATMTISSAGVIPAAITSKNYYEFADSEDVDIVPLTTNYYAIVHRGVDNDGYLATIPISDVGIVGTRQDTYEFSPGDDVNHPKIIHIDGIIYAIFYKDSSSKGQIKTIKIGTLKAAGYVWVEGNGFSFIDAEGQERSVYDHETDFNEHAARHENDGDDEINVGGLIGTYTFTEATAGEQAFKLTVTDSVAQSAGILQSLLVDHNITGTKSSAASSEGVSVDMNIGSTTISAYPFAAYVSKTGNPNISLVEGMNIYLEDMGGGTLGNLIGLDIGINSANVASSRHTGLRIRNHSGTASSAIMIEEAFTDTILRHSPSGVDLNLITLDNSSGAIFYWDDSEQKFRFNKAVYIDVDPVGAQDAATKAYVDVHQTVTNAPTGFPNRTHSVLSFDTQTFTIAPNTPTYSTFDYYIAGVKYTKSSAENIEIANTSGVHFIYYAGSTLTEAVNPNDAAIHDVIDNKAWLGIIYWNATDGKAYILADERHGAVMSGRTHRWLHEINGAAYHSGFTLSGEIEDTDSNAALTFELTNGQYDDEDLEHVITNGVYTTQYSQQLNDGDAVIPVVYKVAGGVWMQDTASDLPYKSFSGGDNLLAYNSIDGGGNGSQVEVGNGNWVSMTLIATNDWQYPIKAIQGQNEYTDKKTAVEEATAEVISFGGGALSPEVLVLYRFVMRTRTTFTTGDKKAIIEVDGVTDFRTSTIIGGAAIAQDHGALGGLGDDDHAQYLLLAGETTDAKLYSGADLIVYSDAGSTEKARIDGATGNITTAGTVDGVDIAAHLTDTSTHGVAVAIVGTTDTQTLTNKTLTSPAINGTVSTSALTMPPFTSGPIATNSTTAFKASATNTYYEMRGGTTVAGSGTIFAVHGVDHAFTGRFDVYTPDAAGTSDVLRLSISGKAAEAVMALTNLNVTGLKLGGAVALNSQAFSGDATFNDSLLIADTKAIKAGATGLDDDYITIQAHDNDAANGTWVEVARAQGAADPYFSVGGTQQFKCYNSGVITHTSQFQFTQLTGIASIGYIESQAANAAYVLLRTRITDGAMVEIARISGAAQPWFGIGKDSDVVKATYDDKLGFFSTVPIAKPTLAADDVANVITALVNLGLINAAV